MTVAGLEVTPLRWTTDRPSGDRRRLHHLGALNGISFAISSDYVGTAANDYRYEMSAVPTRSDWRVRPSELFP